MIALKNEFEIYQQLEKDQEKQAEDTEVGEKQEEADEETPDVIF